MKKKVEGRKVINIVYITLIIIVLFSNFFSFYLSKLLYLRPDYKFNNETEIHFINVGQGDAIAIKFDNGKVMLIDTGTEAYRKKLIYYLDNIILDGRDKIDYLVLTHKDTDHSGNMKYILENYEIGTFYRPKVYASFEKENSIQTSEWYDSIIKIANDKKINMIFNEIGVTLRDGFNYFTWLSPLYVDKDTQSNDFSPIIKLEYKNHSALFTGDVSSEIEDDIIDYYSFSPETLDIDILKVAHHGSYNSTSAKFLEVTSPKYACVSVGENTYGHPSNTLITRILEYDNKTNSNLYSNLYSTRDSGSVIFELSWDININFIKNIDDYSFVSYVLYSFIAVIILIILMCIPYYKVFIKNLRFIRQNKKFKKDLDEERQV